VQSLQASVVDEELAACDCSTRMSSLKIDYRAWRSAVNPRPITDGEETAVVDLLARVFQDDPLIRFMVADKGSSLDRPRGFFESTIRLGLRDGRVDVLPDLTGVGIWLRPGRTEIDLGQMLSSGLLWSTIRMGFASMRRFTTMYKVITPMTKRVAVEPHWLLLFLGVDPALQGQGLGGELINPVLEHADAEGMNCFLESGNERNLSFYRRHGFEVGGEVQVPKGPRVWGMLRRPSRS